MSTLEQLGAHIASGAARALTPAASEALRLHFADTVCAWVAGPGRVPDGRADPRGQGFARIHAARR